MLLDGRRILVTGVLNDSSMAFGAARLAQEEGAEVVLTSFGRVMSLTQRAAKRLPSPPEVIELDVSSSDDLDALAGRLGGRLDGVLHAIAFAPESCLGGGFLSAPWEDVAVALQVSAYSLKGARPSPCCDADGGGRPRRPSISTTRRRGRSTTGWASPRASSESTARYLARDLGPQGIRVNLVSAGPIRTIAARSIPGFDQFESVWDERAPLGWNIKDTEPVAKACVALLSDLFPATTGEMVHVDGGFHAVGA